MPFEKYHGLTIVYADGACRGNPGPMAIGASIQTVEGIEFETVSECIGEGTNNEAEYYAAIEAVTKALPHGKDIELRMDSLLVVKQIVGEYRVKKEELVELHGELLELLGRFRNWSIVHVRREQNQRADALANAAY